VPQRCGLRSLPSQQTAVCWTGISAASAPSLTLASTPVASARTLWRGKETGYAVSVLAGPGRLALLVSDEIMKLAAVALFLLVIGCGDLSRDPRQGFTAPFKYHGETLRFTKGSVDSRFDEGVGLGPWARLYPDAVNSDQYDGAPYYIDLGRSDTGKRGVEGYHLGYDLYSSDALQTDLGNGYIMFCQPPNSETPAFNCAVLLRSLPFAAIQFRDRPSSADRARALVEHAEVFLLSAKERGRSQTVGTSQP
jgi:hypothetical protein